MEKTIQRLILGKENKKVQLKKANTFLNRIGGKVNHILPIPQITQSLVLLKQQKVIGL